MMKKHLVMAVVPFLAFGCGDDLVDADGDGIADGVRVPDSVTVVTPANPKGTVSGQVLSTNLQPLGDVTVEMTIGSSAEPVAALSDTKGNFTYTNVPGGAQVLLTFSKAGYATLRAQATVPTTAGNVPINNGNASFGPITLTRLDGTLNFLVVTPTGRPAAGTRATLEATPAGSINNGDNSSSMVSSVVVEATANEQGLLSFTGIPSASELARLRNGAGQYKLWVSPMDSNGDGIPETGGYVSTYSGAEVVANGTTRLISLPYSRPQNVPLSIESSNVASLRGAAADLHPLRNLVRPGEPIHVFFNQPIQQGSLSVRMTSENAAELLPVTTSVANGGYSATINPGGAIADGREYNIDVRAVSAEGGSMYARTGFFFTGDASAVRQMSITEARYQEMDTGSEVTATQLNSGEIVYLTFNHPISRAFTTGGHVYVRFHRNIAGPVAPVGSGIGDSVGEHSNATGFELQPSEPTRPLPTRIPNENPAFTIVNSGYTSRWAFTYIGNPIQSHEFSTVQMEVYFSELPSRAIMGSYENYMGQPLVSNLTVTGVVQQPAAVPVP
ncbi:carboxypeptidase-like regulatory domain-containing protein [Myxococcus sp. SDU36]|uniref:carboxypeptidase-like regulatory domain-containing protein n=1 Tax=Myxococcus sp. SDU36 TaxID=2831967 RepID=UPI002543CBF5|nr:carboxypeptidase-like regulatory domain-containing protein [Myxococcus sp. SDU36]WIG94559.1 carboxypeptidase-like regulatory domain-containing protein [Myxococcus sp. SDU36]